MFIAILVLCILAFFPIWFFFIRDGSSLIGSALMGLMISGTAYMLFGLIPAQIVAHLVTPKEPVEYPIYSMGDSLGTKGEFHFSIFGGWGSINSSPAFMYYVKRDGAFQLKHVEASMVRIIETNDVKPHYERDCEDFSTVPGWLRAPFMLDEDVQYDKKNCDSKYTFYVPKGSITPTFTLDAS